VSIILVVEDEPATQLMLELMLQRSNHKVVSAVNGEDAIAFLANKPVDLVIADVWMPGMDGLALLQQLRSNERYQNLPIIMFTASGDDRVRSEAKRMGASGFLTKPASSIEVTNIVSKHLGNHST